MQNVECRMPSAASRIPTHVRASAPHSALRAPHSQRGVALVITLVLLSVITFMAVTFLVVTHGQHTSVTTDTEAAIARLAADQARERAIAQLMAPILTWTNEFNYGLLVSTNYINQAGFDQTLAAPGYVNPTNVNYDYTRSGAALSLPQWLQNVANLLYDPRAPVFVTNRLGNSNEFRYYLDLNRNGFDDPNGLQPLVVRNPGGGLSFCDPSGGLVPYQSPAPPNILSNVFIGDPEWIGILQHPEFAHSSSNIFTSRYAFLVVPVGQTLDVNIIHQFAKPSLVQAGSKLPWPDTFLRNQGVLAAEMNLAAFLSDLNTNLWPNVNQPHSQYGYASYIYSTNLYQASSGAAADDAASFMRFRYGTNIIPSSSPLASVSSRYGSTPAAAAAATAAFSSPIDSYVQGPAHDWHIVAADGVSQSKSVTH